MTISITAPSNGKYYTKSQSIQVEYSGPLPVSYQIDPPNGPTTSIPTNQRLSPITIGPISNIGPHTIRLIAADDDKAGGVMVNIVESPDDIPTQGGDTPLDDDT